MTRLLRESTLRTHHERMYRLRRSDSRNWSVSGRSPQFRRFATAGRSSDSIGMRRDFPPSGNGVEAPRLVVFKVINL